MQNFGLILESSVLRDGSTVWSVNWNGDRVATSVDEERAIALASNVLECTIEKTLTGLQSDCPPASPQLPLSFERAKSIVSAQMLWLGEHDRRTIADIVDDKCVEYEWGWEMHWRPTQPYSSDARDLDKYCFPYLIDRVTGTAGSSGGTLGLHYGIILLL